MSNQAARRARRPSPALAGGRLHPALVCLLVLLLAATGCESTLARLTREISPTAGGRSISPAEPTVPTPASTLFVGTPAGEAGPPVSVNANAQPLTLFPSEDWSIPDGHFFTQTNGQPSRTSPTGYSVTNRDGIPFWNEFQRLGGPAVVGYPISTRFTLRGQVSQAFQRAVLQWNAEARQVQALNILLEIEEMGKGDWLAEAQRVPARLPSDFDQGKAWDRIVRDRLALLDASPALLAKYRSAPDALALYGLPDSRVVDQGDHQAVRFQRTVFRLWKEARPWARAGEVTVDNSGEYAKEAGLVPEAARGVEQPPTVPVSLDLARRAPASPAPSPAAPPVPSPAAPLAPDPSAVQVWQVANTDGDGVYLRRTPRLADKIRPWQDGTLLKSLDEQAEGDGLTWYKVQAPDGAVGYVPAQYVRPAP